MRKHLIFLFDGTWMSAPDVEHQDQMSNVYLINLILKNKNLKREQQIVFYQTGSGTRLVGQSNLQGLAGTELKPLVESAYVDLCSNYCKGDTITVLGYSRGAMLARVFAGVVSLCGILRAEKINFIRDVMGHFAKIGSEDPAFAKRRIQRLRKHTHRSVKISFLGLFDAVAGIKGTMDKGSYELLDFKDKKLSDSVSSAVHILAINESRTAFKPTLFSGKSKPSQKLMQVWMPGVHSDIGGGGNNVWLSSISLLYMIEAMKRHVQFLMFDSVKIKELKKRINDWRPVEFDEIEGRKQLRFSSPLLRSNRSYVGQFQNQSLHPIFKKGKVEFPRVGRLKASSLYFQMPKSFRDIWKIQE